MSQNDSHPTRQLNVLPAIDGVLSAFQTHPLVGIGDYHGLAQEAALYADLMRDPRFAREVGNVVVEFGGASHQNTIDRYVAGEAVPYVELRKVWTDLVGAIPYMLGLGYINFYAAVRAVNLNLPEEQRIRVWLGEPEIDWAKIRTREEWLAISINRDIHAAEVIKDQILGKNQKALVIYGTGHFGGLLDAGSLLDLVEKDYPKSFFVVVPYVGFVNSLYSLEVEQAFSDWPNPALVSPINKTHLEGLLRRPGYPIHPPLPESVMRTDLSDEQRARQTAASEQSELSAGGLHSDALLYLGPAASLTVMPNEPNLYLDPLFLEEISRRWELVIGRPLSWSDALSYASVTPRYIRPRM